MKLKVEKIIGNYAFGTIGKSENPVRAQIPVNVAKPSVGAEIEVTEVKNEKFMRLK